MPNFKTPIANGARINRITRLVLDAAYTFLFNFFLILKVRNKDKYSILMIINSRANSRII